jgi:glyoxylase-like metal-dependent hydrolase (beta-lactamase superfamily II)
MRVTEHLYVYLWSDQRENNCNSIVIDGKVPLLIDPGHAHRVNNLFDRMREDGFDPGKIKTVICTHAHPDHFEGTLVFQDRSVKIGMSREEERFVEETGKPMFLERGLNMPDFRVDYYLKDGDLTIGKHEFEVMLTPGHSPGSICIYWPRYRILFPGDVIFMQSIGRSDLPGGDETVLKQSIERLSKIPIELIIPGHGPAIQGAEQVAANFELIERTYLSAYL